MRPFHGQDFEFCFITFKIFVSVIHNFLWKKYFKSQHNNSYYNKNDWFHFGSYDKHMITFNLKQDNSIYIQTHARKQLRVVKSKVKHR